MSKYSPENVVKLKQDIAQLTGEITTLIEKKSSLELEVTSLRFLINPLRGELSFLGEQLGIRVQNFKQTISKYTEELTSVFSSVKKMENLFETLSHKEIVENYIPDTTRIVRQLSEKLEQEVNHLSEKKNEMENDVSVLEKRRIELDEQLERDRIEKTELESLVFYIQQKLSKDTQDTLGLRTERARLELEIANIQKRERDSRVMLNRLSEQYRAVYNQTPHTSV